MNITVTFTAQEAQALMSLIDLAVKSAGMNVAEAGVVLARKLGDAAKAAQAAQQAGAAAPANTGGPAADVDAE